MTAQLSAAARSAYDTAVGIPCAEVCVKCWSIYWIYPYHCAFYLWKNRRVAGVVQRRASSSSWEQEERDTKHIEGAPLGYSKKNERLHVFERASYYWDDPQVVEREATIIRAAAQGII